MALTPIARVDVVPYQRIEHGTTFNFGVVAFSKAGIDKVEFTISGQGYSGGVKTSTSMTLNSQSGVWEYWVPISSSEFTGNGAITVTPVVTGEDAGTRDLGEMTLYVSGASAYTHVSAWVDATNSDGTGTVGDIDDPFPTVAAAVTAAQTANSGSSSGNIIYLKAGTYSIDPVSATANTEWLTIRNAVGVAATDAIIDTGRPSVTGQLKISGITLLSTANDGEVLFAGDATTEWIDNCRLIGSGRWSGTRTNPVFFDAPSQYSTDNYIYNVHFVYYDTAFVRGGTIDTVGEDVFQNTEFVLNTTVSNVSNGASGVHADGYQAHTSGFPAASNRILYNVKMTDLHYQGIFLRADAGTATDNAFVNVIAEMRETPDLNETGVNYSFSPLSFYYNWDHLLVWHCTFPFAFAEMYGVLTNSSFVGNYFDGYVDSTIGDISYGNTAGNVFSYNHFAKVFGVTSSCTQNTKELFYGYPCPHWNANAPDTNLPSTATTGAGRLIINHLDSNFLKPVVGSTLINRVPYAVVPADIYGTARGGVADVGAVEYASGSPCTTPNGIQDGDETGVDCGGSCPACSAPPSSGGVRVTAGNKKVTLGPVRVYLVQ